jgi:multiple sugar transport system permease protein
MSSLALNRRNKWAGKAAVNLFFYLLLILVGLAFLLPFLWMLSSSLKSVAEIFSFPPRWFPRVRRWSNYIDIFIVMPFGRFVFNSFKVSLLSTIGVVLSSALAAFAFARLRFPGRNLIFALLLSTLMLPGEVTLIPIFFIMRTLGVINTHIPLYLPDFFGNPFGTFLLRQFFLTVPKELEDAAKMDGAGPFTIFGRIFLPLAKPALATLAVLTFMWRWEELIRPVIYLGSREKMTLTVGLTGYFAEFGGGEIFRWDLLMAGSVVSLLPILVLFIIGQRFFIEGIKMTGIKG